MQTKPRNAAFISDQVESGEYYYLNLTPSETAPAVIACGGREVCRPDYRIARDGFRFHSIEYVVAGKGVLTLDDRTFPLRPGVIFCYTPTMRHAIATDSDEPMTKYFVDFTGSLLTDLLAETAVFSRGPLYMADSDRIHDIFRHLQQSGTHESPYTQRICAALLEHLILLAAEHGLTDEEAAAPAQQTYRNCLLKLENHFLELKTLADLARICFVSEAYLCRLFKRYAGCTPCQSLLRLKMRRAAEQLANTSRPIKQIAQETGFPDPYHFSRLFKKLYGISPREFARTARRFP